MSNSGFDKKSNKIVLINLGNIFNLPPVINLVKCLINNNYKVHLISENVDKLPKKIIQSPFLTYNSIRRLEGQDYITRIKRRFAIGKQYRKCFRNAIKADDILWTTTDATVRILGKDVLKYKHVMQMMELEQKTPLFNGAKYLTYPIEKYARRAWKTVVPERNRAYLEKIWWGLKNTPFVLPNKPYDINTGDLSEEAYKALEIIKNEKKKVVIYLGVFAFDRDLGTFAEAINRLGDEYALYLIGRVSIFGSFADNKKVLDELVEKYPSVHYLGFFPAPMHLEFLKYAHIGLLPYYVNPTKSYSNQINVLYCAPNKIFEYAGFGIPMIGTDVLGLKEPFERYDIGVCCTNFNAQEICEAIERIEGRYKTMSDNCRAFYDSVDFDKIVLEILK